MAFYSPPDKRAVFAEYRFYSFYLFIPHAVRQLVHRQSVLLRLGHVQERYDKTMMVFFNIRMIWCDQRTRTKAGTRSNLTADHAVSLFHVLEGKKDTVANDHVVQQQQQPTGS